MPAAAHGGPKLCPAFVHPSQQERNLSSQRKMKPKQKYTKAEEAELLLLEMNGRRIILRGVSKSIKEGTLTCDLGGRATQDSYERSTK